MYEDLPIIWLEIMTQKDKSLLICNIYREWTPFGIQGKQLEASKIIVEKVHQAAKGNKKMLILRDFNLDTNKLNDRSYQHHQLRDLWTNCLSTCGFGENEIRENTFFSSCERYLQI